MTDVGRKPLIRVATYALLLAVSAAFVMPLVWMFCVSLKPADEVLSPQFLPSNPQMTAYKDLLQGAPPAADEAQGGAPKERPRFEFALYARNTLIILVLSLAGVLFSCSVAAYGFARIQFPGRNIMFGVCLATMMIPFPVIMVPTYIMFKHIGWIGTFNPLWVPAWFASAFNVFLLRQFFMGIPKELEESAMLDGCSTWGCFWRIMLPLARPALAVVALFHCLAVWNDFVGPLIFLTHQDHFTLALGLQFLQSRSGDTPWNQLMAASTLIVLPVIVMFVIAQRELIRGIATTGLKG